MINIIVAASAEILAEAKGLLRPDPNEDGSKPEPVIPVLFPALLNLSEATAGALTHDGEGVRAIFKTLTVDGVSLQISSFYAEAGASDVLEDFQMLEDVYPENFAVMGAWEKDDGEQLISVSPLFINFMPDIQTGGTLESPVFSEATELSDVNLLAGQAPRDLS